MSAVAARYRGHRSNPPRRAGDVRCGQSSQGGGGTAANVHAPSKQPHDVLCFVPFIPHVSFLPVLPLCEHELCFFLPRCASCSLRCLHISHSLFFAFFCFQRQVWGAPETPHQRPTSKRMRCAEENSQHRQPKASKATENCSSSGSSNTGTTSSSSSPSSAALCEQLSKETEGYGEGRRGLRQ